MTLFAHRPGALSAVLLLPTAFICSFLPPHQSGTPLPSGGIVSPRAPSHHASGSHHDKPVQRGAASADEPETTRLSALSTYRAHMMLVTVLAILAVDFPVFPRMLAKCETYGVSFVRSCVHHACSLLRYLNTSVDGHGRWLLCIFPRNCFRNPGYTTR